MRQRVLLMVGVSLLLLVAGRYAVAGTVYGTVGKGGTPSTLVKVDSTTGALVQTIGSIGYSVNGLAFDPTTGILYGSTSVMDGTFNGLITINPTTGAGTPVGLAGWGLTGTSAVTNITFDSLGQMYGWWDPSEDDLVSIDKGTGVATRVGESGVSTAENGLAFDNGGSLFMVNFGGGVYLVNPLTGAATSVGSIGTTAHHGVFDPATNYYVGISTTGSSPSIISADLSSFSVVNSASTVSDLHTLAFQLTPAPIPEPGTFALMGFGLLGVATVVVRRRRAKK